MKSVTNIIQKNLMFLNSLKPTLFCNSKDSKSVLIFSSFSGCWIISNLVMFQKIKIVKHIWGPCCGWKMAP